MSRSIRGYLRLQNKTPQNHWLDARDVGYIQTQRTGREEAVFLFSLLEASPVEAVILTHIVLRVKISPQIASMMILLESIVLMEGRPRRRDPLFICRGVLRGGLEETFDPRRRAECRNGRRESKPSYEELAKLPLHLRLRPPQFVVVGRLSPK